MFLFTLNGASHATNHHASLGNARIAIRVESDPHAISIFHNHNLLKDKLLLDNNNYTQQKNTTKIWVNNYLNIFSSRYYIFTTYTQKTNESIVIWIFFLLDITTYTQKNKDKWANNYLNIFSCYIFVFVDIFKSLWHKIIEKKKSLKKKNKPFFDIIYNNSK